MTPSFANIESAKWVETLPYPDFVAFIGQDNSPPGRADTLLHWAQMSKMGPESIVLDLACSTGYSGRFLSRLLGCAVYGIDQSALAVTEANRLAHAEKTDGKAAFCVADAINLPFNDSTFSHIVAGSAFGFIQNRFNALDEAARVLRDQGRLCVASYFYLTEPPSTVLDRIADSIGYRPDSGRTLDYWFSFFSRRFQLEDRRTLHLPEFDEATVLSSVHRFIFFDSQNLANMPQDVKVACWKRLAAIRMAINEHRKYQSVKLMVWRLS